MRRWFLVICLLALTAGALPQAPDLPAPGTDERGEILDTARIPAQAVLRQPVDFQVSYLRVLDGWALLRAAMEDSAGRPLRGGGSDDFAALLNRQQARWHVVAYGLGSGAVAWQHWAGEYGAPKAIFDLGQTP